MVTKDGVYEYYPNFLTDILTKFSGASGHVDFFGLLIVTFMMKIKNGDMGEELAANIVFPTDIDSIHSILGLNDDFIPMLVVPVGGGKNMKKLIFTFVVGILVISTSLSVAVANEGTGYKT